MTDEFARELGEAMKRGGVLFCTPSGPVYWDFDVRGPAFVAGRLKGGEFRPSVRLPYDEGRTLCEHLGALEIQVNGAEACYANDYEFTELEKEES